MVPSVFNLSQSAAVNGIFKFFFSLIHIGHGCSAPTGLVCTDSSRTVVTFTVKDFPVSHLGSRVVPFTLRPPSEQSATFTATSASLSLAPPSCSPPTPSPSHPPASPPLPSLFDVVTLSPSAAAPPPPPPSPAAPPETRRAEWERLQREIRVRSGREGGGRGAGRSEGVGEEGSGEPGRERERRIDSVV